METLIYDLELILNSETKVQNIQNLEWKLLCKSIENIYRQHTCKGNTLLLHVSKHIINESHEIC